MLVETPSSIAAIPLIKKGISLKAFLSFSSNLSPFNAINLYGQTFFSPQLATWFCNTYSTDLIAPPKTWCDHYLLKSSNLGSKSDGSDKSKPWSKPNRPLSRGSKGRDIGLNQSSIGLRFNSSWTPSAATWKSAVELPKQPTFNENRSDLIQYEEI